MYKCPFHYIGGKSRLLDKILPLINRYNPDVVIDLFAGGFSIGANVQAQTVIYNDKNQPFANLIQWLYRTPAQTVLNLIDTEIANRGLSKTNKAAYDLLKNDYNQNPNPLLLYLLICYAFNHQMRFNHQNLFNTPFGKDRSSYNPTTKESLELFIKKIQAKNIQFFSSDFQTINPIGLTPLYFVDPPYLLSTGSYNDGNRGIVSWTDADEDRLYQFLDSLNQLGIAFVLTNFLRVDDKVNEKLAAFSARYIVQQANTDYSNSNYHKKDKVQTEIIVRNFL